MRIQTRLKILIQVSVGSLLVLVGFLVWFLVGFEEARINRSLIDSIINNIFEQSSLRDQYFLYREARAHRQWFEKTAETREMIQQVLGRIGDDQSRYYLQELLRGIEDDEKIVVRIIQNSVELKKTGMGTQLFQELDKRLLSQSLLKNTIIHNIALALREVSLRERQKAYHRLIGVMVSFATILALVMASNLLFVRRLIRQHVLMLHTGTGIIAEGRLDYRLEVSGTDELAAVAQAVNRMTDKLQAATHQLEQDQVELQQKNQTLSESESRFRALFENAPDAIFLADPETGFILDANATACRLLKRSLTEIIGLHQAQLHPPPIEQRAREDFNNHAHALQDSQCAIIEQEIIQSNGNMVPVDILAHKIMIHGHEVVVGVFRDITERKQAEAKLHQALEAAEAAAKAKSDFLSVMSHEIRTPMNVVVGMVDVLQETPLNPEQQDYLRRIQGAGKNLVDLINQILDLAKIEAGGLQIVATPVKIRELMAETVELLRALAQDKGLTMGHHVAAEVPEWIFLDGVRLKQILFNLLGNALKFTEQGTITLSGRIDGPDRLHLSVQDTGIGMDLEQQDQIFEPFTQADASITRRYGGTGLGLAISRRLVERMGGRIWVESRVGIGSSFHILLPLQVAQAPAAAVPVLDFAPGQEIPLRILLVDDSEDNQLLIRTFLKHSLHSLVCAANGEEAVAMVKKTVPPFEVVFMDVQMPIMDGYTATRTIRQWERETGHKPLLIVALTAHALEGEAERSREAGCDLYLSKPIKKQHLLAVIQQIGRQIASRKLVSEG